MDSLRRVPRETRATSQIPSSTRQRASRDRAITPAGNSGPSNVLDVSFPTFKPRSARECSSRVPVPALSQPSGEAVAASCQKSSCSRLPSSGKVVGRGCSDPVRPSPPTGVRQSTATPAEAGRVTSTGPPSSLKSIKVIRRVEEADQPLVEHPRRLKPPQLCTSLPSFAMPTQSSLRAALVTQNRRVERSSAALGTRQPKKPVAPQKKLGLNGSTTVVTAEAVPRRPLGVPHMQSQQNGGLGVSQDASVRKRNVFPSSVAQTRGSSASSVPSFVSQRQVSRTVSGKPAPRQPPPSQLPHSQGKCFSSVLPGSTVPSPRSNVVSSRVKPATASAATTVAASRVSSVCCVRRSSKTCIPIGAYNDAANRAKGEQKATSECSSGLSLLTAEALDTTANRFRRSGAVTAHVDSCPVEKSDPASLGGESLSRELSGGTRTEATGTEADDQRRQRDTEDVVRRVNDQEWASAAAFPAEQPSSLTTSSERSKGTDCLSRSPTTRLARDAVASETVAENGVIPGDSQPRESNLPTLLSACADPSVVALPEDESSHPRQDPQRVKPVPFHHSLGSRGIKLDVECRLSPRQTVSRWSLLGERDSPRHPAVRDSHRHLGDWMNLVDLVVAEKASAEEKNDGSNVLAIAARSLGALGLLAAGATECTAAQMDGQQVRSWVLCGTTPSAAEKTAPSSGFSYDDPIPLPSLVRTVRHRVSRSFSPRLSCATPLFEHPDQKQSSNKPPTHQAWRHHMTESDDLLIRCCRRSSGSSTSPHVSYAITTPSRTPVPLGRETPLRKRGVNDDITGGAAFVPESLPPPRTDQTLSVHIKSVTSIGSSSILLRAPCRKLAQGRSRLLRGIRFRNVEDVSYAVMVCGADPNGYLLMSTAHVPWTVSAPALWGKNGELNASASVVPARDTCLHPLHLAAATSSPAVVRALLRLGACPNALDEWHRNPLHVLLQPPPWSPSPESDARALIADNPPDGSSPEGQGSSPGVTQKACWEQHHRLAQFLLKQTLPRPAAETKVAELLCAAGVNIMREDTWGRTCVDYATSWIQIQRLVHHGILETTLNRCDRQPTDGLTTSETDCGSESRDFLSMEFLDDALNVPHPISRYTAGVSGDTAQALLRTRIPEMLTDIVVLHEDRLRLDALRSIVGVGAGGPKSPTGLVLIYPYEREGHWERGLPGKPHAPTFTATATPNRGVADWRRTSIRDGSASLRRSLLSSGGSMHQHTTDSGRRCQLFARNVTLYPPRPPSGATEQTSACRVSLRIVAETPGKPTYAERPRSRLTEGGNAIRNSVSPQRNMALSCLRVFHAQMSPQDPSSSTRPATAHQFACHHSSFTTPTVSRPGASNSEPFNQCDGHNAHVNQDDNDELMQFLRLAAAPSHRFHPALSAIWEFLGATLFPHDGSPVTTELRDSPSPPRATIFNSPALPSNLPIDSTSQSLSPSSLHNPFAMPAPSQIPALHTVSLSPLPILLYPDQPSS